ncbi:MAG: L,D-transpeptidase family protein, partial [Ferruginibacter sp.]|nr:L,D-transpeptidase family protein [Cytophagales bacterium]
MKYFYPIILLAWCFSCAEKKTDKINAQPNDGAVAKATAKIVQALPVEQTDSLLIQRQLQKYHLDSIAIREVIRFYADTVGNHSPYALIWSKRGTVHTLASMFINLVNHAQDDGLSMKEYRSEDLERLYLAATDSVHSEKATGQPLRQELDVLLTATFLTYAPRLWKGKIDPSKARWFIAGKSFDYHRILVSLLEGSLSFKTFEPLHREYGRLRKALQTYRQIAQAGGWPLLPAGQYPNLANEANREAIFALKKRLQLTQDISRDVAIDSTFDEPLRQGLRRFQQRHGLAATGTLTAKTLAQLNVPVEQRINQILLNMERWRWVPASKPGTYLGINIPEFVLHAFENNRQVWQMDVIVGKTAHATTIFNDEIEHVVLNPTWGVPRSIAVNEILPKLKADANYLENHQMELFAGGSDVAMGPNQVDW